MLAHWRIGLASLLLFVVLGAAPAAGGNQDADGIPDDVERRLGTDPKRAERPQIVWKDRDAVRSDRVDIRAVAFTWVGKGRTLWRIDLASEWLAPTRISNMYFDLDLDSATGRKKSGPITGADLQLGIARLAGSALRYRADGTPTDAPGEQPRCWATGNSFYVCLDTQLLQRNGRTLGLVSVLVQRMKPTRQSDLVGRIKLDLPPEPRQQPPRLQRPRPTPARAPTGRAIDPARINGDFERGLEGWVSRGAKTERATKIARVGKASMKISGPSGKRNDFVRSGPIRLKPNTYYRFSAWMRIDRYPPAIEPRFVVARVWGDTYDVRKVGQWQRFESEFLTPAQVGPAVIELFKGVTRKESRNVNALLYVDGVRLEELKHEAPRISRLEATPHWDENGRTCLRLTWITQRPYAAEVKYGRAARLDRELVEPRSHQRNHRVIIPNVSVGEEIAYRLTLVGLDGTRHPQPRRTVSLRMPKSAGGARRRRVELRVAETAGLDRHDSPATFGVPLPQGDLADPTRARMFAPSGRPVRLQTRVLSRWPDGSIRWLLLDFPAEVAAGKTAEYTLEYGTSVEPFTAGSPLTVSQDDDRISVTTGPIRFTVGRGRIGPFGRVQVDRNNDGRFDADETLISPGAAAGFVIAGTDDRSYAATAKMPWAIEERGPQKVVLRGVGHHVAADGKAMFPMTVRVTAYAGQPTVRLRYTFENDQGNGGTATFRALRWRLPVAAERFTLGAETPIHGRLTSSAVRLRQPLDDQFTVTGYGKKPAVGQRAPGGVTVSGSRGAVTVAVRDFWQLYPKGLSVARDRLDVELCPPLDAAHYAGSKSQWHKLYFYCREGFYRLRTGVAKRHEWLVRFDGAAPSENVGRKLTRALANPLMGTNPRWFCGANAMLTPLVPKHPDHFVTYEEAFDRQVDGLLKHREQGHEYGMLNYGDWYGERRYNWGNLEYDIAHVCLVQYVRTGNRRHLRTVLPTVEHTMDVDLVHHWPSPETVGKVWIHCLCHTGYRPEYGFKRPGGLPGGFTQSHTWTEGLVEAYWLTGDRRALGAARMIADAYGSYKLRDFHWPGTRSIGWMMTFFNAVYQATLDPYYLNAMRIVFDTAWAHRGDGAWQETLHRGHCNCKDVRHHGGVGFMHAVLLSGLVRYHRASGDPRAAEAIVAVARDMNRTIWNPLREAYRYSACPRSPAYSGTTGLAAEGQLYAHALSRDPAILKLVTRGLKHTAASLAGGGGFGKGAAFTMRNMPPALAYLAANGVTGLRAGVELKPVSVIHAKADGPFSVRLGVRNLHARAIRCRLEAVAMPDGWTVENLPRTFQVAARSRIGVPVPGRARPHRGVIADAIRLRFTADGQSPQTFSMAVVGSGKRALRASLAVAGKNTHVGDALRVMSVQFTPVGRLAKVPLTPYAAILAGWEPFRHNRGGIADAWAKVAKYVRAGGILVLFQADDKSWPEAPELTGVVLQEPRSVSGRIVSPGNELLSQPHRVTNLSGVRMYDVIERVAPPWEVLVTDIENRPAVIRRKLGRGHILLVQPSYERLIAGHIPAGRAEWRQAWLFFDNLLSWIDRCPSRSGRR